MSDELSHALSHSVNEGVYRLRRDWPSLLATGFVGGVDVSIGVFGAFLVLANGGSEFTAAIVFGFGFIALTMAGSELFTENFLMPVMAVATRKGSIREVGRLWFGTAAMNIVGGLLLMALLLAAFPELGDVAIEKGGGFVDQGPGLSLFLSAMLAGIIITLMTWMQVGAGLGPQLVAAVGAAFLLHYGGLAHVVVASLEIFAGMFAGSGFTVTGWAPMFLVMGAGNMIGGIGLVTLVRLVQVGRDRVDDQTRATVAAERDLPPRDPALADD